MTISSSLSAGVSGLAAQAARLAGISDNIANASTFGYRRVETDFQAMVSASNPTSGGGVYAAGGVRATAARNIAEGGTLTQTRNATDLSVSGSGMLPVTRAPEAPGGSMPLSLVSTGSFRPDETGLLRTPEGLTLLAWPAGVEGGGLGALEPVRMPSGRAAGEATRLVELSLNLPADGTREGADLAAKTMAAPYYGNLGQEERLELSFVPLVAAAGDPPTNQWRMSITDGAAGGASVGEVTLSFSDARADAGRLSAVTATGGATWDPVEGEVAITTAGGPMSLSIGRIGAPGGITQFSGGFDPLPPVRDGSPSGVAAGIEVDEAGRVFALYDAGFTRQIYTIPLGEVPNPNGLTTRDGVSWSVGNASGALTLRPGGAGGAGEIRGFSREESTVDTAAELTDLIRTQRAYSSNAKVIQTVDEMLQETTNIKR